MSCRRCAHRSLEAENSADVIRPSGHWTTVPAVWAIAAFVFAHSRVGLPSSHEPLSDAATLARNAAPPYTWHDELSHVLAYE